MRSKLVGMRPSLIPMGALVLMVLAASTACRQAEPPVAQNAPQRVDNPGVGISLADVPDGFRLVSNEGDRIVLERASQPGSQTQADSGRVEITATEPKKSGANLVAAVNDQKTEIEGRPEGKFEGQVELASHLGTAYLTRGRWTENGKEMEEMRLFSLHPEGTRMLVITYTYAVSGDTRDRANQAMDILSEVEAPGSTEQGAEPGGDTGGESPGKEPDS